MDQMHPDVWQELTASQRDLLVALAIHEQGTGAALNQAVGRTHNRRNATHRDLLHLRERGLIDAEEVADKRGRPKYNQLTDAGEQLLIDTLPNYHRGAVQVAP